MRSLVVIVFVLISVDSFSQRDLTPTKRKDAFGTRDFRNLNNYGIQFQIGATTFLTRLANEQINTETPGNDGFRGNYTHDPYSRVGVYGEIGMFHFPKRFPKIKISDEKTIVLISYYDWGLGFKYFRGGQEIQANFMDAGGTVVGSEDRPYNFTYGSAYGRFSAHKNINLSREKGKPAKVFLDNSLGINFDYRVMGSSDEYSWYSSMTDGQAYSKPLQIQLHYGLGVGFRLKRGSWLIPGVRTPLVGFQKYVGEYNVKDKGDSSFGRPSTYWFSSRYWPLLIHVKYMFALEKKAKGCPAVEVNDQDRNTNKSRK